MTAKRLGMAVLILGIVVLTAEVAFADFETILKIGGVAGQSKVDSHATDWEQISGMIHPSRIASGAAGSSGARTGRVESQDFSIVKELDKSTPTLGEKFGSGEHIPEVTLELRRAGGDKQVFLKIKMTDVKIVRIQPAGSRGGTKMERVTFRFKTLKWERPIARQTRPRIKKK